MQATASSSAYNRVVPAEVEGMKHGGTDECSLRGGWPTHVRWWSPRTGGALPVDNQLFVLYRARTVAVRHHSSQLLGLSGDLCPLKSRAREDGTQSCGRRRPDGGNAVVSHDSPTKV
jgi:hypothetical protein